MSHRVTEIWMGERTETLEDLIPPNVKAICVGINPAPISVEAGHYYQGQLGQRFFDRLRAANVLPPKRAGCWDDDEAYKCGIGFTDLVKRPTASADSLNEKELTHGRQLLVDKLVGARCSLVIFTFKKTYNVLFGPTSQTGHMTGRTLGVSELFVMPGPYAPRADAQRGLDQLNRLMTGRTSQRETSTADTFKP